MLRHQSVEQFARIKKIMGGVFRVREHSDEPVLKALVPGFSQCIWNPGRLPAELVNSCPS